MRVSHSSQGNHVNTVVLLCVDENGIHNIIWEELNANVIKLTVRSIMLSCPGHFREQMHRTLLKHAHKHFLHLCWHFQLKCTYKNM